MGKNEFVVLKIRTSRKVILILYRRYGSTGSPRAAWGMLTTSGLVKAQHKRLLKYPFAELVEGLNERMKAFLIYRRYGSTGSPRAAWGMLTTSGLGNAHHERLGKCSPRAAW
jgi:hypothetical protein